MPRTTSLTQLPHQHPTSEQTSQSNTSEATSFNAPISPPSLVPGPFDAEPLLARHPSTSFLDRYRSPTSNRIPSPTRTSHPTTTNIPHNHVPLHNIPIQGQGTTHPISSHPFTAMPPPQYPTPARDGVLPNIAATAGFPGTSRRRRSSVAADSLERVVNTHVSPFVLKIARLIEDFADRKGLPRADRASIVMCVRCFSWYASSSLCSNTSKQILNAAKYPITLTIIQFIAVASLSFIAINAAAFSSRSNSTHVSSSSQSTIRGRAPSTRKMSRIMQWLPGAMTSDQLRPLSRDVVFTVLPVGLFQGVGHILTSQAMSRIPVSTVHTIKALSPLFTVAFFRIALSHSYPRSIYISLVPLTVGVMLVTLGGAAFDFLGSLFALLSTLIFVLQNVFSKKLFVAQDEDLTGPKMDKMNLLFYSSLFSFLAMSPLWLLSDGWRLTKSFVAVDANTTTTSKGLGFFGFVWLILMYIINGLFQYMQSVSAFSVLELTSPVTYSVASLVKRVFVILTSIMWFHQTISMRQAMGILLTFVGLSLYRRAKEKSQNSHNILPQHSHST